MKEQNLKIWNNNTLIPLEDPDVYSTRRYNENVRDGLMECGGLRNTGRTIRMILQVVESYRNNPDTQHYIITRGDMDFHAYILHHLHHFIEQMGIYYPQDLAQEDLQPIHVIEPCEFDDFYRDGDIVFKDNSVTDKEKP